MNLSKTKIKINELFNNFPFRNPLMNSEYDQFPEGLHYNIERDEMFELENLFDASSGRSIRSKSRHKVGMRDLLLKIKN